MATDPVCYMIVDEDGAEHTATYRNRHYYFCSNYCKKKFEEDPKKYSRHGIDASIDLGGGGA